MEVKGTAAMAGTLGVQRCPGNRRAPALARSSCPIESSVIQPVWKADSQQRSWRPWTVWK